MVISELLGFTGAGLVIIAYLPQVIHLIKERCSAGISLWTYQLWLAAAALLLAHAAMIGAVVFIILQAVTMILTAAVIVYAYKYHGLVCESHRHSRRIL
jgi:uncharacterized protein with PQ loop repeat